MPAARLGAAALLVVAAGCAPATPSVTEIAGQCGDLFGTSACTWASMEGDSVTAIGATIPMASIEGAPADPAAMDGPPKAAVVLAFPEQARQATGFDHLTVDWEPHGHPPGAFLTPHFDFHFYAISSADRMAIDCSDTVKPDVIPTGYALPDAEDPGMGMMIGLCVPRMGMHSLPASDLTETNIFNAAMIIGYYHGAMIFNEPMIAKAYLEAKQDFTLPMPAVIAPAGVRAPTTVRAVFDSTGQAWRFEFSGFGG